MRLQGGHVPEISEDIDSGTYLQTGISEERAWKGHKENGEWHKRKENGLILWCGHHNNSDCIFSANQIVWFLSVSICLCQFI